MNCPYCNVPIPINDYGIYICESRNKGDDYHLFLKSKDYYWRLENDEFRIGLSIGGYYFQSKESDFDLIIDSLMIADAKTVLERYSKKYLSMIAFT